MLTHGPVVGGVTDTEAKVFVRTDVAATVMLQYSSDPLFGTYSASDAYATTDTSDFTTTIPLSGLSAETTYYLRVLVNGLVQNAPPYPSFTSFAPPGTARNFNFVVLTDLLNVSEMDRDVQTFQLASNFSPAFVFLGGDFDHRNPGTVTAKRTMFKESTIRIRRI